MKGVYPCILIPEKVGGFSVIFPDFAGATQGETLFEALEMAEDFLGFAVTSTIDDGFSIPEPTALKDIVIEDEDAFTSWIRFDTDAYRKLLEENKAKESAAKTEPSTGAA